MKVYVMVYECLLKRIYENDGIWKYMMVHEWNGSKWMYMKVYGAIWWYNGCIWRCTGVYEPMDVNGSKWMYMKVYEAIWPFMNVYEGVWMYMSQYDGIWKYMNVYECIWCEMVYECLLKRMDVCRYDGMVVYGAIWWYMGAYEGVRVYMSIWWYMMVHECKW